MNKYAQYQRAWREAHPHYQRDYMRATRGAKPRKSKYPTTRCILGVIVKLPWLRVTKAQAEREFLALTGEDFK